MFPSRLLKSINWTLAIAMLLQPVLAAIPSEVVRAAPAEVEPQAADPASNMVTESSGALIATTPWGNTARQPLATNQGLGENEPLYVANNSQLARTYDFFAPSPTWQDVKGSDITGTIYDFVLDPRDPYDTAFVGTSAGLWRTNNLSAANPTWTMVLAELAQRVLFHPSGRLLVSRPNSSLNGVQFGVHYSDDGGNTWEASNYCQRAWGYCYPSRFQSLTVSPDGTLYGLAYTDAGGRGMGRSRDAGTTWEDIGGFAFWSAASIYSPHDGLFYIGYGSPLSKYVEGQGLMATAYDHGQSTHYESIRSWPEGGFIVNNGREIYVLDEAAATHELLTTSIIGGSSSVGFTSLGDTQHLAWGEGSQTSYGIIRSNDSGATWEGALGNWTSAVGSWAGGNVYFRAPVLESQIPEDTVAGDPKVNCPVETCAGATQGMTADPVNTRTGNNTYHESDLGLTTECGDLAITRSYSTFNARDNNLASTDLDYVPPGVLGNGWYHNYEVHLLLPDTPGGSPSQIQLQTAGGSRLGFANRGDGTYSANAGAVGTLTRAGTAGEYTYTYTNTQDVKYIFDNTGRLTELDNGRGQSLKLGYNGDRLDFVAAQVVNNEPVGRYLTFAYTGELLTGITDSAGRSVGYGYDAAGNLTSFTDMRGQVWTYEYGDTRYPHYLTARRDPLGNLIVSHEYDDQGRAFRETDGVGRVTVELAFDANGTTTVIYGQDGVGGKQMHAYDVRRTLIDRSNIAGGSITNYDGNFRPGLVTDANDNATDLDWSDDGANLESVTDALGNPTGFAYDDRHHLTLVTNADGSQTFFVYNTAGATNPLTSEAIYNSAWDVDLLLMQIDNYNPLNPGADANLVTRYTYTSAADAPQPPNLVKRIDAPGGATCTAYNEFGQQTESIQDCGGAHEVTSTYAYDDAGRLVDATQAVGTDAEQTTHYVYIDDDNRADEVISHYDGSDLSAPANYYKDGIYNLSSRTYLDALGRVVATVSNYHPGDIPGGTGQNFDFDGDGTRDVTLQLSIEAPEYNQVRLVLYDAAGRVYETIASYWPDKTAYYLNKYNISSRTYYDRAGRVVATVSNYNAVDLPGSRLPQPIDFDGDGATDATLEVSPDAPEFNQISRTVYDSAGRVSKTISTAWPGRPDYYLGIYNLVSVTEYDAAGNVLKSISNYDPNVSGGYIVSLDLEPDPDGVPETTIHVDPAQSDRNQITCTEYDALNRPTFTRSTCVPGQPDYLPVADNLYNIVSATYYDDMGRQIASVRNFEDPDGDGTLELTSTRNFISRTYYDGLGRAETVVENFVGDISNPVPPAYDPATPNRNLVSRYLYDGQGRQIVTVSNLHNPDGGALTQSEIEAGYPDRNLVSYTRYNASGQVAWTVANYVGDLSTQDDTPPAFDPAHPDQNLLTHYVYDEAGRRYETSTVRDGETRTSHTDFDVIGRTSQTFANYQDGTPGPTPDVDVRTSYAYESLGRISETIDPEGRVRRSISEQLDAALGRTSVSITDPDDLALTSTSVSNAAGQTVRSIDASGRVTVTRYDAQGRAVETIADPDGLALTTSTTYDLLGRAVTSTDAEGVTTRYQYDNLGRLRVVFESYVAGRNDSTWPACQHDVDTVNVCTRYAYDDAGNLTVTVLGNGSGTTYEYDVRGQITRETVDPGGENIVTAYAYDATGNQVTLTRDPGGAAQQITTTFYDRLGRATGVDYVDTASDVVYSYDAWGNRATMIDAGGTWTYLYDAMNHLTSVTDPQDAEVTYQYDATGNRTDLTAPGMDVDYTYDHASRLDTVSNPFGEGVVDYAYDDASRLTGATLPNSTSTTNSYDTAGRLLHILNAAGADTLSAFLYMLDDRGNRTDTAETLDTPGVLAAPAAAPTQPVDPTPELPVPGPDMTATLPADPTSEPPTAEVETTTPQPSTPEPATSEPVEDTNTLFSGTNPLVMPAVSAPVGQAVSSNKAVPQNEALLQSTPPIAPSSLVVTTDGPTQLTISWQDNSEDETGFLLEWSTDGGSTWTQLADQTIASFAHTPLLCQTTHTYRVRAYNTAGSSEWATGSGMTGSCQPGMLDATFGEDGIVTTGSEEQLGQIFAVALQPDGKIVAAGYVIASGGEWDVALARYNPDGSLDASFGAGGIATNDLGSQWEEIHALALQPDGKIVVAVYDGSNSVVARYNADGSLDTSFGVGGIVTAGLDSIAVASVALQPDGKIVVAGGLNSVHGAALARYNADGSLDTTFGTNGVVSTQIDGNSNVTSMRIEPDGKIVAGGWMYSSDYNQKFVLYQYLSDGALDTSFGTDGIVITDFGLDTDEIEAIAFQPDGKIVAAGRSQSGSAENTNYDFALARYFSDGSLDASFGAGGKLVTDLGTPNDGVEAVVVQNDGKIIAVGSSWGGDGPPSFALVRYTDNGSLDTSFSDDGVLITPVGLESGGSAYAAVLQSDGKLIAAGTARYNFTLVRYYTTASLTAPTDLTTTPSAQAQIDLAWTDNSSDETGFRIERSPDGAGEWTEIGSTEADIAAYQDSTLVCDTAYSYRVRAYRAGDGMYSDYSNVVSTSTDVCQDALTITGGPLDFGGQDINATSAPQTLTLTNSGSADLAIESISVSGEFALVESGSCPPGASTLVVGASCTADVVFMPISAGDKTGQLTVTGVVIGSQTVDLSGTGNTPSAPAAPTLVSPATGTSTNDSIPTFSWNASTSGYQYQIQVDNSGTSFPSPEINVTAAVTTYTADTALADGTYRWRVRSINSLGVTSAWSAVWSVIVDTVPPAAPVLSAPANDTHVSGTPTYSWAAASTATAYQFEYDDNTDFSSPVHTSLDTLTAVSYLPPTQDPGTYVWHVRARDAAGNWSVWSTARTVTIVPVTPAAPTLLTPANSAQTNDTTPGLTWSEALYGVRYQLQIDNTSNAFPSPEVNVTTSELSYTPGALADGVHYWRARTQNVLGVWGAWGTARSFTIDTVAPDAPALNTPADGAIVKTARPALALTAVTTATRYRFQWADNPDFTGAVEGTGTAVGYTLTADQALAYGKTFYWHAQAGDAAGNWGEWSEVRSFAINMMTAPADGSTTTDVTPPFSWTAVSGATYALQVDDNSNFSSPLVDVTRTTNSYTPTTGLPYGTLYWRLQVLVGGEPSGSWMGPWSFIVTTTALAAPALVSPAASALTNDNTPPFSWNTVTGANAFQIQVDNSGSAFPSPEVDIVTGGLSYTPGALADGVHYWRARTRNVYGVWGAWGTARSFTVDATPPAAPALSTPADSAIVKTARPALALTAVSGATRYRFQVADNLDFTGAVEGTGTAVSYTLTAAQALAYGGTFYWRAQAGDAAGNWGEWSTARSFAINMMTAPADGSFTTSLKPAFSWTAVSGATYHLQVADNISFFNPGSGPLVDTTVSTASYTPTTNLPYGTLYWRLQVLVSGAPVGSWMGPWTFIVTPALEAAPTPISPANGFLTTDNTPTFTWNMPVSSKDCQIQADNNGNTFPSPEIDDTSAVPTYTPATPLPDGTYTWRMRARNRYGVWGSWGPATPWTVTVDTTPPAPPALTSPVNYAAVVNTPAYSWAASTTATAYQFEYDDDNDDEFDATLYQSDILTTRTHTPPTQPPGEYFWRVRARDAAGNWSAWSAAWQVSIAPPVPAAPTLVSPASGSTTPDNTPELVWNPVAYGVSYQVQVDNSGTSFPSPEQNVIVEGNTLTTIDLPNATYRWRVRAINSLGQRGAWSAVRSLIVNATQLPAPDLVSPEDGATVTSATPEFTWNTVVGGERYQVQIADEAAFANVWQSVDLPDGITAYTAAALPAGAYYWRVRARDTWGVAGTWSVVRSFTVDAAQAPNAWHYEYDALSRVTYACSYWAGADCRGDEFIYEYDGAGNLLRFDKWNSTTNQVETVRYVLSGANQIACIDADNSHTCNGTEFNWVYDAYGNLKSDGTTTYAYDEANRVETITASEVTTTYTYNGDGDRISQTVSDGTSPVTTTYLLDTATPLTMVLAETNTTTSGTTRYWHALDTLAQSDGTTTQYFAYDGLGSVRQLVDASGSVGLAQTFDPYGNGYTKAGSAASSLGFTGEQTDTNGFVFLRARYYQPGMGRFTQMDPSRQERNAYQYAASSPTMVVDPSGLVGEDIYDVVPPNCIGPIWECWSPRMVSIPLVKSNGALIDTQNWYSVGKRYARWLDASSRRELAAKLANELAPLTWDKFDDYGMKQWEKKADGTCDATDCAIFASYILWRAGFRMSGQVQSINGGWQYRNTQDDVDNTNIWYANLHVKGNGRNASWEGAGNLYNYWLSKGARSVKEKDFNYTLEKGDLIFYNYLSEDQPEPVDHVAVVVNNQYFAQLSQVNPGSPKFREILSSTAYKIYISHRGGCPSGGTANVDYDDTATTGYSPENREEFGLKMPY